MIVMVFFDVETEEICRELGYQLIMPSDELRLRTATPSAGGTWPRCTCGRS